MDGVPERFYRDLLRVLSDHPEVRRVILFGSRARGDAQPRSDIDLAVEAPDATSRQWRDLWFFLVEDAETLLHVDAVRLEEAPPELRERIVAEGKVLYERPEEPTAPQ